MTRACLTRYAPPSGFRTLLTVCPPARHAALFQTAEPLMGFCPYRASPSERSRSTSRYPRPPCRQRPGHAQHPLADDDRCVRARCGQSLGEAPLSEHPSTRLRGLAPRSESVDCGQHPGGGVATSSLLSWGSCLFRVLRDPDLGRLSPAILLPWAFDASTVPRPTNRTVGWPPQRPSEVSLDPDAAAPAFAAHRPS
jgi:hypothetical protein